MAQASAKIVPFMSSASPAVKALGIGLGTLASALGGYYAYRSAAQPSTSRVYSSAADEQASSSSSTESLKDRTWAVLRSRQWQDALVGVAGVYGAVGVGCGAFGFHGLRRVLSQAQRPDIERWLNFWNIGKSYMLWHSAAGLGTAALPTDCAVPAGLAFAVGNALFSCSIFAYVLTGKPVFQFFTPFGGISYMAGWAIIGVYHFSRAAHGAPASPQSNA